MIIKAAFFDLFFRKYANLDFCEFIRSLHFVHQLSTWFNMSCKSFFEEEIRSV